MSKRIAPRKPPGSSDSCVSQILADYAVALNDKSKIETENAVLKMTTQEQCGKISKLSEETQMYKATVDSLKEELDKMQLELNDTQEKYRSDAEFHEKMFKTYMDIQQKFKTEIGELTQKLSEKDFEIQKMAEETEMVKNNCKHYKEKLRSSLNLLSALNNMTERKILQDKESQTEKDRSITCKCKTMDISSGGEAEFDERILSELFYKENPFLDSYLT